MCPSTINYMGRSTTRRGASMTECVTDSLLTFHILQTNRLACLRLTERCADILLCVREEIHEAGDEVGQELQDPLQKLT